MDVTGHAELDTLNVSGVSTFIGIATFSNNVFVVGTLDAGLIDGGELLMAKPTTRDELKEYCLRQLGAPVFEINVADEQIDDLLDDTLQYFNERHFDGVEKTFLKYQITQDDINRGRGSGSGSVGVTTTGVGIVTTTGTSTNVSGLGTVTSNFYETSNFHSSARFCNWY